MKQSFRSQARARQGSALVASLIVVASIAALGAYIVQIQSSFSRRQTQAIDRKRALYISEAGLAEASLAISMGKSGVLGSEEVPVRFHDGVYWVESEALSDGRKMLTSRGQVGTGQFTVRQVVTPNVHPIGALGLFGDEGVHIGEGVVIDGCDSRERSFELELDGTYPFTTSGEGALVRSNGDIVTDATTSTEAAAGTTSVDKDTAYRQGSYGTESSGHSATYVLGMARPGPSHMVVTNGWTEISSIVAAEEPVTLPQVVPPATVRTVAGTTSLGVAYTVSDASCRLDRVEILPGGHLTIVGPSVLHFGSLEVRSGGSVTLDDAAGPVYLCVDDELRFRAGSTLASAGGGSFAAGSYLFVRPSAEAGVDDRVTLECSGEFRGVVYAPGDRLRWPSGLRSWGAVAAKHLTIEDGARLTYDSALRIGSTGVPAFPSQLTWQILVEPEVNRGLRFDPLTRLALAGITPLAPQNASPETAAEVVYVDTEGDLQRYTGAVAGFDFGQAPRVLGMRWQDPVTLAYSELVRPTGMDPDGLVEVDREVVEVEEERVVLTESEYKSKLQAIIDAIKKKKHSGCDDDDD